MMQIDPGTASVDELKAAEKVLAAARRVAYCRENGHDRQDLHVSFPKGRLGEPLPGDPLGVECVNCGARWAVSPGLPAVVPLSPFGPVATGLVTPAPTGDALDDGTIPGGYAVPPFLRDHPLYAAAEASVAAENAAPTDEPA